MVTTFVPCLSQIIIMHDQTIFPQDCKTITVSPKLKRNLQNKLKIFQNGGLQSWVLSDDYFLRPCNYLNLNLPHLKCFLCLLPAWELVCDL